MQSLKTITHQTDIKELVTMKADCVVASRYLWLGQKVVLEHTARKITVEGQLAHMF